MQSARPLKVFRVSQRGPATVLQLCDHKPLDQESSAVVAPEVPPPSDRHLKPKLSRTLQPASGIYPTLVWEFLKIRGFNTDTK